MTERAAEDFCGYPFAGTCDSIAEIERLRSALEAAEADARQYREAAMLWANETFDGDLKRRIEDFIDRSDALGRA